MYKRPSGSTVIRRIDKSRVILLRLPDLKEFEWLDRVGFFEGSRRRKGFRYYYEIVCDLCNKDFSSNFQTRFCGPCLEIHKSKRKPHCHRPRLGANYPNHFGVSSYFHEGVICFDIMDSDTRHKVEIILNE